MPKWAGMQFDEWRVVGIRASSARAWADPCVLKFAGMQIIEWRVFGISASTAIAWRDPRPVTRFDRYYQ